VPSGVCPQSPLVDLRAASDASTQRLCVVHSSTSGRRARRAVFWARGAGAWNKLLPPSGNACLVFDAFMTPITSQYRRMALCFWDAEGSSLAPGFPGVASVCSVARAPCCPVARLPAAGLQEAHAAPRHIKRGRDRFVGVAAKARPQTFRWTWNLSRSPWPRAGRRRIRFACIARCFELKVYGLRATARPF